MVLLMEGVQVPNPGIHLKHTKKRLPVKFIRHNQGQQDAVYVHLAWRMRKNDVNPKVWTV